MKKSDEILEKLKDGASVKANSVNKKSGRTTNESAKKSILAINTAFMTANLAFENIDGQRVFKDLDAECKHSENILKTIDQMCQQAGVEITEIDTLAVVTGPGSFTGLRIGTAIGKALGCVMGDMKFLPLSSLELMAYIVCKRKLNSENFVCVLNALSNLYFVAYFDANGIKLKDERMIDKCEFDKISQKKFVLKGDLTGENLHEIEISSADLLGFARLKESENCFVKRENLVPKYIRLSQAEDNLIKNLKK